MARERITLTRAPSAARSQATPVRFHALSIALDAVNIRIQNSAPGGARWQRLQWQRRALETLNLIPVMYREGGRA